ncbi:glycoside hydrolase family 1 protein [Ignavigranum ruoffiae]|uniref:glycoside hydrolase family 1 protein n=1 Tax=Ignavigranum ruoffiae TaxID=89093 RepID=UPI0024AD811C|nr:glycoside hydrolase family 1 protein [Ignavigranum ruoffiae]
MFAKDFLWGSASAAYQVEGAHLTDGKAPSIWDEFVKIPGKTFKRTTGKVAVDHYHRYKEDVALMAEMGLKAYRFSIAWSRILPEGRGQVNQAGIEFYSNLIDELIAHKIEPIITIYHWDLPQALQDEYKGWESRRIIEDFVSYARILFQNFGDRVKYWVTLNEQNIFINFGYNLAMHPPGIKDPQRMYQANHIANLANASVISLFHEMVPDGKIGPSFAYSPAYALDCNPQNVLTTDFMEDLNSHFWLDVYLWGRYPRSVITYLKDKKHISIDILENDLAILKAGQPDFLGINYYQSNTFAFNPIDGVGQLAMNTSGKKSKQKESGEPGLYKRVQNPYLQTTNWDWEIDPTGLRIALNRLTSRYDIPILITENGLGEYDQLTKDGQIHDDYRINYLETHIQAIEQAIADGSQVFGYCTWSFTDLLSWLNGYQKRYGLVYVDRQEAEQSGSLQRIKKDSYYWYKNFIQKQNNLG